MDVHEALNIAIGFEHKVRDHYAAGAAKIFDARGKRLFEVFAQEEQRHVDYLESRVEEWKTTGKVTNAELGSILPPPEWIAQAKKKVETAPANSISIKEELDLLKVALDLEKQTSAFYRELVNTLPGDDRPMFARFLEIEEGHVSLVQAEIDALAGHGYWFDIMEFRLEAG
ncbi:MAG: ferritin family protein [Acidobacteria bacterium]|nr:ferritin family protein [Acidobacteriota bacterium]